MSLVRSLLIVTAICIGVAAANAQTAFVTFLNNSADVSLKTVDLYVTQQNVTEKIEDLAFQQTKNLEGIFGDLPVNLKVAPGSSTSISEAVVSYDFTPKSDSAYMAIVSGVRTPAQYAPNPNSRPTAIAITTFLTVLEIADHSKTGFYTVHGSTDLEAFDVYFRGNATPIATNQSFGDRTPNPVSIARTEVTVDVTKAGDKTKVLGSFALNIPGLSSEVVVLIVSGFKTPGDNNGSTDSLALLAVLENGLVVRAPLIAGSQTARVQVINNLPEIQFSSVDIWLKSDVLGNPIKKIDNLSFRGATGFIEFPSGTPLLLGIALATSSLYKDTIFTHTIAALRPGRSYTFVLTGVNGAGFLANPEGVDTSAIVAVLEDALESPTLLGQLAVRAGNFTTDAQPLTMFGRAQYITGASYLEAAPQYVDVAPGRDTIWVRDDSTGARIKGYVCTACDQSRALLVLTSGFRHPDSNNNGPAFKLIFVQTDGNVISNAVEVDTTAVSVVDEFLADGSLVIRSYPNPTYGDVTVAWGGAACVNGYEGAYGSEAAGASLKIFDVRGNLLLSASVEAGIQRVALPTSGLPAGVHIARVSRPDGTPIGSTSFSVLK